MAEQYVYQLSPATLFDAAAALAAGDATSTSLCRQLLARHEATDNVLNGYRQLDSDAILEQAAAAGEFDAHWETAKQDVDAGKGKPLDDLINDDA